MESFIKYYGIFDGFDDNVVYEFLIDLEYYVKVYKLKDEDVVLGFLMLLRGNVKCWFIYLDIDKINFKRIMDVFKFRFLNLSECLIVILF